MQVGLHFQKLGRFRGPAGHRHKSTLQNNIINVESIAIHGTHHAHLSSPDYKIELLKSGSNSKILKQEKRQLTFVTDDNLNI